MKNNVRILVERTCLMIIFFITLYLCEQYYLHGELNKLQQFAIGSLYAFASSTWAALGLEVNE